MSSDKKNKPKKIRSGIALGMILNRTGIGKVIPDRRTRRAKDAKNSWRREYENE